MSVIAEFDTGDLEATLHGLADEVLKHRHTLRLLAKAAGWADAGAPYALIAPGPYWRPRRARDARLSRRPRRRAWGMDVGDSEVGGRTEVGFGHASRFNLDSEGSTSRRRR